jgi:hypothetical protein
VDPAGVVRTLTTARAGFNDLTARVAPVCAA